MILPRPIIYVPKFFIFILIASLGAQLIWHHYSAKPTWQMTHLAAPPDFHTLNLLSLGNQISSSKFLMLWLQSADNQTGRYLDYDQLNYVLLEQWLMRILQLDPRAQYPLLTASHIYTKAHDLEKKKRMLEFVYQQFLLDPARRWRWLAHVAVLAKHRLHDLPLALKYAHAIAEHADEIPNLPYWAHEMRIFILEDMGEFEQARLIIGGLLAENCIDDPKERQFLAERLKNIGK